MQLLGRPSAGMQYVLAGFLYQIKRLTFVNFPTSTVTALNPPSGKDRNILSIQQLSLQFALFAQICGGIFRGPVVSGSQIPPCCMVLLLTDGRPTGTLGTSRTSDTA